MIQNFKDKEAQKVFERKHSRKLPLDIQQVALRKLRMLNRAETLQDLRVPPANRLERLVGDREGQYSIRVNDQWRICFVWQNGD
ncbi:MAG: type II toxin-antitoxin system RelE/ParE family toxin, partial [Microcystis aeruginosa]